MVSNAAACLPDGAIALEAPTEAQLPDAIALVDVACVLQIGQDVPAQHVCLKGLHTTAGTSCAFVLPLNSLAYGSTMPDATMVCARWRIGQQSWRAWHGWQ